MDHHKNKIRRGNLGLQGGGSACAYQAGVLHGIISDTTIEFNIISGTSGGGLNGAAITQPINKFGWAPKGRSLAQDRLVELWNDIAQPDLTAQMGRNIDNYARLNPFLYPVFQSMMRGTYSKAMEDHLQRTTLNPNALQKSDHVQLIINAVDGDGNQKLFSGDELNAQSLMATGALPSHFHAVSIGGVDYWDGALLGGTNPPMKPLLAKKPDFIMFVMTNPPEHPITPQQQCDLSPHDVADTNGLVIHQSYNEIAWLLERQEAGDDIPPIHVISPENLISPWTPEEKQMIDESVLIERIKMGKTSRKVFFDAHSTTLHQKSSITLKSLKAEARRNYQSCALVA